MTDNIPADLKAYAQWVVWRSESRDNSLTKIPYDAKTGGLAAVDNPATWSTFEQATNALSSGQFSGRGFVLTDNDPFAFIDLDIKGEIAPSDLSRQIRIQESFNTYSERSPSGTGLHVLCRGSVPRGRKRSNIEVYSSLRYMTVTGDVFDNKPIEERQALLQLLWSEMGAGTPIYSDVDQPQTVSDSEIVQRATNAANGAKFVQLLNAQWEVLGYPSQSEADFALIDMLAYYTQNREQIVRLFRQSWLGQRPKANRIDYISTMVNRSFDRMLPQINFDALKVRIDELVTGWTGKANGATPFGAAPLALGNMAVEGTTAASTRGVTDATVNARQSAVKFPPGLLGEIATFILQASQRPVAEVALASAIGLMAGMCGRAYNTPTGAGLNVYTLLIALSGIGKEAMSSGISRLTEAVAKLTPGSVSVPSVREFIGPSEIRSDAALIKEMEKRPCFVSIIGEFGLKLGQMHHPNANAHMKGLKSVFLDLYHKSGKGNIYRPMAYSDSAKNTKAVEAPAFSILAESTPSTFYEVLDESLIAQGLLSRFLIIEYFGQRPPSNETHTTIQPSPQLQTHFGTLAAYCHTIMHSGRTIYAQFYDQQTYQLAKTFDQYCDREINATDRDAIRDLWNRGHLKTLKLASLVAVGIDPYNPMITSDVWQWAQEIVEIDIRRLLKRFEKGDVGQQANNETQQTIQILRIMREFMFRPWGELAKYKCGSPAMQNARVIPHAFINKRLVTNRAFKTERMGASNAIMRTIKQLMEGGIIAEVTGKQKFDVGGKCYMISDTRYLTTDED